MSAFEMTEEHFVFLTSMVLQGGSIRSDRFSPAQVQTVIELVEGKYLSREEEGTCSAWAYYSINDLSLEAVKTYGHNVLDDAIAQVVESLKEGV